MCRGGIQFAPLRDNSRIVGYPSTTTHPAQGFGSMLMRSLTADQTAMQVMLGRVFLSIVDDRMLAKVLGPAPQSANCRGALPTSSRL
jgi:hypothetical protein